MQSLRLWDVLIAAERKLNHAGVDTPSLDARWLIEHALGLSHVDILSQSERILTTNEMMAVESIVARREKREPVARILGEREFWSMPFGLNEATLEPRPDSETVIEAVLTCVRTNNPNKRILDLGTGTGCLLLALLRELPTATGLGIDIAPRAVEQAIINSKRNGLHDRSHFQVGNWFEGLNEKFDIIVSNPPYIPARDIKELEPEVRQYDPLRALDGGADGLDFYRHIIACGAPYLMPEALLAFEVGQGQAAEVMDLLKAHHYTDIKYHLDLAGIERCVTAQYP